VKPARWASAIRVLLLGAATLGCFLAVRALHRPPTAAPAVAYVCPMHASVSVWGPGDCPICGMALVARASLPAPADGSPALPPGSVDLPRRRVVSNQPTVPARVLPDGTLEAIVYDDDLAVLAKDEHGQFRPSAAPSGAVDVVRAPAAPLPWDESTHRVAFLRPGNGTLVAGTVGWLELPERSRPALVVPATAILQGPEGPAVLAVGQDGEPFRRIPVSVGRSPYGLAMVLSGLRASERVLVRGAFFVDASQHLGSPGPAER
jgi:hypothetical protein